MHMTITRPRHRSPGPLGRLACAAAMLWVGLSLGGCAGTGGHGTNRAVEPVSFEDWREGLDDRLRADVEVLAGEFPGRSILRPERLRGAADWLEGRLRAMGYEPRSDAFTVEPTGLRGERVEGSGPLEVRTLIVEIEGDEDPGAVLVLGAHYDAVPQTPGADDNASGVAVGLALAEYFRGRPPPITLRFEFYPNEEFVRADWGSLRRARAAREVGEDIRVMLSLEMLGYFSEQRVDPRVGALTAAMGMPTPESESFVAVATQPRFEAVARRVGRAWTGPVAAVPVAARLAVPLAGRSDNWAYWQAEYPAAIVTDTSFLRNDNYHTPSDTADTLDYTAMAHVTESLRTVVETLAEDPPPSVLVAPDTGG